MHFRTRMILIYTVFVAILAAILAAWYSTYSFKQYKENEYRNLELLSGQLSEQLEETVKPMKFITNYLLSDMDVLDALRTLAAVDSGNGVKLRYSETAKAAIRSKIYSDYIMNNFYRVIVYNQLGDVIANNNYYTLVTDPQKTIDDLSWLNQIKGSRGTPVLLGPHTDDWGAIKKPEVYSIVKEIQGKNLGYIEVQKVTSSLGDLLAVPKEGIRVVVVINGKEFLYTSEVKDRNAHYISLANENLQGIVEASNPYSRENEIVSIHHSGEEGISVLVIEDTRIMSREAAYITPMTILIAGIFFMSSLIFVFVATTLLTKPIRSLVALMENTRIENLEEEIVFDKTNDEFEALNKSYQKVLNRLNEAIIKEKRMSLLQLQAQFDLLQTQVNPHFLYNVLNVISNKGIMSGDESICEICDSLAAMLRYSTNNKKRYASIAEEMEYLTKYFYLLKSRYEYKIEYAIDLAEEIKEQIVPKIFFQQVVENSINHGFKKSTGIMKIEITGWKTGLRWFVSVKDNGQGFGQETILHLNKMMSTTYEKLMKERNNMELEIGGMGIINMYARLLLLYGEDITLELMNQDGGAKVLLSAPMGKIKEV